MATNIWEGESTAQAQVDTFTVTNAGGGTETWTFTITDERGDIDTSITFVDDGTPTASEVVAGLVAAWNASTLTNAAIATAVDADPYIAITVDSGSAGIPMTVTLAASGTGAITKVSTTANKGPNDYNTVENWTLGAVPAATNNVRLQGTVDILYGLDQSGTEIYDFIVENYSGTIGGTDGAYLQVDLADDKVFAYRSSGRGYIDIGTSDLTATTGNPHRWKMSK